MTQAIGFPFKPGDWVSDSGDRIARVKAIYADAHGTAFDLVMFDRDGERLGRVSPSMGGPRKFEPACSVEGWERIKEPTFPVALTWKVEGGKRIARYWAGDRLPPVNWIPPKRKLGALRLPPDNRFKKALEKIADGHNDPRQLAKTVLAGGRR